jgi:hypothetical protein
MPRSGTPFAEHFPRIFELLAPHRVRLAPAPSSGLDASCDNRSVEFLPRVLVRRCRDSPPALNKTCTEPVRLNWYRIWRDFVQLVLVLDQFCPIAQLFPPRRRATFERKLKYETVHTIACPENPPVAGSKGLPEAGSLAVADSEGSPGAGRLPAAGGLEGRAVPAGPFSRPRDGTAASPIFSLRGLAKPNR